MSSLGTVRVVTLPGSRPARDPERALRSGHHNLPRELVVTTQRERIIDAFVQVVASRGYQHTTVASVCKEAGVSSKTFYVHFTDKEDCFLSAYDLGIEAVLSAVSRAYEEPGPWAVRLRAALSTLLGVLASEPAFARMCLVEVNAAGPKAIQRLSEVLRAFRAFFDDAETDMRFPEIAPEVTASLVPAVIGGIYTRIYAYVVDGATADLSELLPAVTYFALLPFLGRTEAAKELG